MKQSKKQIAAKLEAITFWVNGGNLWAWHGRELNIWNGDIDFSSCEPHDYIIEDENFAQRAMEAFKLYTNGALTTEEEIKRVVKQIEVKHE